jgi:excisionase family DNA binding protein
LTTWPQVSVHPSGTGLPTTRLPWAARTGFSLEELAAYLGVPKKTVYGCWRQWGLRGYRVGRYLRFRERHVEEWLQTREI